MDGRRLDDERLKRIEKETTAQTKILLNIFKDMREHRKEFGMHKDNFAKHELDDEKRLTKLESNNVWVVRVLIGMVAAIGTLFGIKA